MAVDRFCACIVISRHEKIFNAKQNGIILAANRFNTLKNRLNNSFFLDTNPEPSPVDSPPVQHHYLLAIACINAITLAWDM